MKSVPTVSQPRRENVSLWFPLSLQLLAQDPLHTDVIGGCGGGGLSREGLWSDADRAVVVAVFQLRGAGGVCIASQHPVPPSFMPSVWRSSYSRNQAPRCSGNIVSDWVKYLLGTPRSPSSPLVFFPLYLLMVIIIVCIY